MFGVDPVSSLVRLSFRLVQIGGEPFDPDRHTIDFTLQPPFNRAIITKLETSTSHGVVDVTLFLDPVSRGVIWGRCTSAPSTSEGIPQRASGSASQLRPLLRTVVHLPTIF